MDILNNFGGNEKIFIVIDLESMFSKCLEQFVDYFYVNELSLLISLLPQLVSMFFQLCVHDALQLLPNQILKLFVTNSSDVASQDHPLNFLLQLLQSRSTFLH